MNHKLTNILLFCIAIMLGLNLLMNAAPGIGSVHAQGTKRPQYLLEAVGYNVLGGTSFEQYLKNVTNRAKERANQGWRVHSISSFGGMDVGVYILFEK